MFIFYTLFYAYVCFPFLHRVKFCSGCFRQVFFHLVTSDRCSSFTVTIAWEFALADPALVDLDDWSSYRGGCLNRFDCSCVSLLNILHKNL